MRRPFQAGLGGVLALLLAGLASSCATPKPPTEDDPASDIPWNAPQTWEGTIPMPGMPPN